VTLSDVAGVSVVLNWNLIMSLIVIIVVILGAVGVYVYSATRPRRRVR
jgi:heme/copper-type cytochrome/quinol oxidase subunit 2